MRAPRQRRGWAVALLVPAAAACAAFAQERVPPEAPDAAERAEAPDAAEAADAPEAPDAPSAAPHEAADAGPAIAPERLRPLDQDALRDAAFAPDRLRARRRALLAALPDDAVLVVVAPPAPDEYRPYRPDPNFLYLTGLRDPGLTLLASRDEDVLFAPRRDPRHELWNGPRMAVGTAAARGAGFGEVVVRERRTARLNAALARGGRLYLLGATPAELGLPAGAQAVSPARHLAALRQVKDEHEVALLARAIDITAAALREGIASMRPGQFEYEVQAAIEYVFLRYGAQRPGFASIVGSGPNSCILHYTANRRRLGAGELVVLDVGAELWGYTADVSRTVPTSGRFSPRQREVYELVLAAQEAGIAAVRPGATLAAVDEAARAVIDAAGMGAYFLHFTSHWLGLDVHDVGQVHRPLEPGMVLTVEPGLYIAAEALGVRIEDDVLVTEDGARVLSDGVPRTVAEIEALMRGEGVGARPVAPLPARSAASSPPRVGAAPRRGGAPAEGGR